MDNQNPQKVNFINYLRSFAVICILLCHLVQVSSDPRINSTSQIFNIGVSIFFLISGFCFGLQGNIRNVKEWYLKRLIRIYIPYEIFMILLLLVYFIKGYDVESKASAFLRCFLGIQGSNVDLLGADHTWFITSILLFYIATPLMCCIWNKIQTRSFKILYIIFMIIIYGVSIVVTGADVSTSVSPIFMYNIAYISGREFHLYKSKKKAAVYGLLLIALGAAVRIFGLLKFDSSDIYGLFVGYGQYAISFGIGFVFLFLFDNAKRFKVIELFNKISFEIYLYHYALLFGPIYIYFKFSNKVLGIFFLILATLVVSLITNKISEKLTNKISSKISPKGYES